MQTKTLDLAIDAAQRFITTAVQTQPAQSHWSKETKTYEFQAHGKEVSATKRASMDLTRALADLRANR